jgi:hypothetical protein
MLVEQMLLEQLLLEQMSSGHQSLEKSIRNEHSTNILDQNSFEQM